MSVLIIGLAPQPVFAPTPTAPGHPSGGGGE